MAWKYLTRGTLKNTPQTVIDSHPATSLATPADSNEPIEIPLESDLLEDNTAADADDNETTSPSDVTLTRNPILSPEDELFLQRISTDFESPPLPPGKTIISDDGEAIDIGAERIPLPMSPDGEAKHPEFPNPPIAKEKESWTSKYWSFVPDRVVAAAPNLTMPQLPQLSDLTQMAHLPQMPVFSRFGRKTPMKAEVIETDEKHTDTQGTASTEAEETEDEQKKEARDLSMILSNLNLSAINNRVIGVSKDSQRLLESFTVILKDIINGVPTAYDDLETLLTDRQAQLDKMYNSLPPFLQSLVQSVPTKMYAFLAPQLVAAVAAAQESKTRAASGSGVRSAQASSSKSTQKRRMTSYIPNLRSLITHKGAVAAMLRSIISFLELRFPMLLAGTNMIMSLAVFLLLFVFWYCHKRGKEARLEKTKVETDLEASVDDLAEKLALPAPETIDETIEDGSQAPAETASAEKKSEKAALT